MLYPSIMDVFSYLTCLIIVIMLPLCESMQSETDCLRSIKESLQDPLNRLSTWQFNHNNNTSNNDNYTCSFEGVECWDSFHENRVLTIDLHSMGLIGEFPRGIANCSSLTGLDLSDNRLHGSIPSDISDMMTYVTTLDLSYNKFSGEIPAGIANCVYLNVLKLNNNLLTGRIPQQLATLRRLRTFTVAHNHLSGPIRAFQFADIGRENYANNRGLCGYPLDPCEENDPFVNGLIVGWTFSFALVLILGWFFHLDKFMIKFIRMMTTRLRSIPPSNRTDTTTISMLEKFATRMSFLELGEATNNFSENNIISIGETGTTYKGTLTKDSHLAITRLLSSPQLEHQFQSEITILGRFRHKNLVPLIGFCHEFNGSFIICKFMASGSLHDFLFSDKIMEWAVRVRIAVGIAKGIVWLHQNRLVHRGISSKCVLLDDNFDPKISDFGKATTPDCTYLSSLPACYEEDVYGFGVVLLELITRKRHEEFINSFESTDLFQKISELQATGDYDDEMCRLLGIARKCVECDPGNWPSMAKVYQMLIGTIKADFDAKNEI